MGKTISDTLCCLASISTLLANSSSLTVALTTDDCNSPTFAEMSGLVWTAAYCRAPMRLRRELLSSLVTSAFGCSRLVFGTEIGDILSMYPTWSYSMLQSSHCLKWIPVYLNSPFSKAPNLKRFSTLRSMSWNLLSPPAMPSSTCMPKAPWHFMPPAPSGEYRPNTHGSKGHWVHPCLINSSLNSQYHK